MGLFNRQPRHSHEYPTQPPIGSSVDSHTHTRPHPRMTDDGMEVGNPYMHGNRTISSGYGGNVNDPDGPATGYILGPNPEPSSPHSPSSTLHSHHNSTHNHSGAAPILGIIPHSSGSTSSHGHSPTSPKATTQTIREAHKLDRKAKMESTMGGLLCNSTMKAKAHTHHAQADHLRMQASELSEAERLEAEAGMRRQRAVGLGADPALSMGTTGYAPGNRVN